MKLFRFRFIILGLLLCIFHVWCRTCGTVFTDPASSTYLAQIVIEGRVSQKLPRGDLYSVRVYVNKVRKGDQYLSRGKRTKKLIIGDFSENISKENCIPNITTGTDQTYIFFLKNSSSGFVNSAFPVKKTKKTSRDVRKLSCRKCDKAPTLKTIKQRKFTEGKKLQLSCRIRSARPAPNMSWEKNGKVIQNGQSGFKFKTTKRGIVLRKRRAKLSDSGTYVCEARNVVGKTRQEVVIKVIPRKKKNPEKSKTTQNPNPIINNNVTPTLFYECPKEYEGQCFNGGTCEIIADLGVPRCRCKDTHTGERCEQRRLPKNIPAIEDWDQSALEKDRILTIVGIVIGILIFVCICIASYLLAKRRRDRFFQRQALKRQQSEQKNIPSYSKLSSVDEVSELSKFKLYEVQRVAINQKDRETQTDETSFLAPNPHTNLNLYLNPMENEAVLRNTDPRRNSRSRLSAVSDGRRSQNNNTPGENNDNHRSIGNNERQMGDKNEIKNERIYENERPISKPKIPKFSEADASSDEEQMKHSLPSLHISEEDPSSSTPLMKKSNTPVEIQFDDSPKNDGIAGKNYPVTSYTPTVNGIDTSPSSPSSESSSWGPEEEIMSSDINVTVDSEPQKPTINDNAYTWNERGSPEIKRSNRRRRSSDTRKTSLTSQNENYLLGCDKGFYINDLRDDGDQSIPV